jgi:SP family general alpha glucoside:H+ symporter-like MFS transporter
MMAALAMIISFIFIPFFAPNVQTLIAGAILAGYRRLCFRLLLTLAYASEVCPVALRACVYTFVNLCWVVGQMVASGVLRGVLYRTDEWAYKM